MIELTTPRPGESWLQAVRRQAADNSGAGLAERAIADIAELQAAVICGPPLKIGLVRWNFAAGAAFRDALIQAEIRLRFEQRKAKMAEAERGPWIRFL